MNMKPIDAIISDALAVSAVLGQEIAFVGDAAGPAPAPAETGAASPIEAGGPAAPVRHDALPNAIHERLSNLSDQVQALREDVYQRGSEPVLQAHLESIGVQIEGLWKAVPSPLPLIGVLGMLWRSLDGDFTTRRRKLALTLLSAAFLADHESFINYNKSLDLGLRKIIEGRRQEFRSLFVLGQIDPFLDFAFLDDSLFLEATFIYILSRLPDANGLASFGSAMASGRSRSEIYDEIAQSEEAKRRREMGLPAGIRPPQSDLSAPAARLFGSLVASLACVEAV